MLNIHILIAQGDLRTVDIRGILSYFSHRATDAYLGMSGLSIKISYCLPWKSGLTLLYFYALGLTSKFDTIPSLHPIPWLIVFAAGKPEDKKLSEQLLCSIGNLNFK
jgi:hypothetical protein